MGNALLDENKKEDPKEIYEQWLQQNPDLVSRKVLTFNNIFEANFFKYCEFSIKMEVFFRRDDTNIQEYLKVNGVHDHTEFGVKIQDDPSFTNENNRDEGVQRQITAKIQPEYYGGYASVRAYDFIATVIEQANTHLRIKKQKYHLFLVWIIYQMVFSVYTIHEVFNIYHGNIRTSNFLINNYQYLYLTDFASYKPTYILLDTEQGLREFRLFYASSLEKCNIAPEKLVEKQKLSPEALNSKKLFNFNIDQSEKDRTSTTVSSEFSPLKKPRKNIYSDDGESTKLMMKLRMMDMFSLGLTILQVLNDGRSPMSYSDLLRFKKEGLDFSQIIKDSVGKLSKGPSALTYLLANLLKQNPEDRISAEKAQQIISSVIDHEMYFVLWTILSAFSKSSFTSCDLRIKLIYQFINFIETQMRATNYKWANQPPRCLSNFNALKIFVQMLDKKNRMIFSPHLEGDRNILDQLISFFEKTEEQQKQFTQNKQDTVQLCYLQSNDQRRKFFIPTAKQSKIAKRLSIAIDLSIKTKELCPPTLKDIQHLFSRQHEPIKLTSLQIKSSPLQQMLRSFKQKQYIREQRLKQPKYYSISQILIKVVFGCIRGSKYVASKLVAIEIMAMLGKDCSDHFRLHILLPYLMHISEDNDISVGREAFFSFVDLFYYFIDPFNSEEDTRYYEVILQYLANIIRYSKNSKLRATLFSNFKQVFSILQWLEIHYRRFNSTVKIQVTRLLDVLQANYGYFSKEEIRLLLNGNIPDHYLPHMFKFYLSIMNSDKLQGLKLSSIVAMNVSPVMHRDILDVFDSCVEGGLDQAGIALVYSIQYFTIRKNTSTGIIRKIAPHIINSSKWVRDQALKYIKMCLSEFPPTKTYFFFKDIFPPPFPLKPEDIEEQDEVLLPPALKDSDIDWNQKRLRIQYNSLTINLFVEYLLKLKTIPKSQKKKSSEQVDKWNETLRVVLDAANEGKLLQFETYIKRQLQLLYQYNFLYYVQNLLAKYSQIEKDKPQDKSYQLSMAFKKINKPIDLTSIDYQKKELFQHYQAYINSSFQRILYKKNRDYGQPVSDKIKLAEAIITIGEVLCKFEMFNIRPIPKLGTYIRPPNILQKINKPKGILISQVFQHTDTVTCLEKVADQFILSGSADGSLRIFDARKIQANVTMSSEGWVDMRGEGEEKAKISAVATFDQTYAAVVGSNRGQIRVYPLERFQKNQNINRSDEIVKYAVGGQLQKIVTLSNQLKNECFCYITAEGNLGVQDIRVKSRAMGCSIGRERGLPRALCATNRQSILVGTIDGYVIIFDVRFNVISGVLQLQQQRQTLPITNIVSVPSILEQSEPLFAFTYPSKHFEFCCFNLQENKQQFGPERQYTSNSLEQIVTTPSFINRTSDQQFKLCRNGLVWRKNYQQLRDFSKNFNIFDYLSDPLTLKEAKIREVWLDNSKNRYNQISSLYNKRSLPFLEYTNAGILTACNPLPNLTHQIRQRPAFAFLTERKEPLRQPSEIERPLTIRPNNSHKIFGFNGQQTREYFTCCKVLPNLIVAGCRNSHLKIYI